MHNQDDNESDVSLILAWKTKLMSMSKTINEGFQLLDIDDNKKVGEIEVQAGLATCGKLISKERASQLIEKFVSPGGKLNHVGYVRLMASIGDATEDGGTEKPEVAPETKGPGFDTLALHAGYDPDKNTVFGKSYDVPKLSFEFIFHSQISLAKLDEFPLLMHHLQQQQHSFRSWAWCTPRCSYL
jgi:hypothetical protein